MSRQPPSSAPPPMRTERRTRARAGREAAVRSLDDAEVLRAVVANQHNALVELSALVQILRDNERVSTEQLRAQDEAFAVLRADLSDKAEQIGHIENELRAAALREAWLRKLTMASARGRQDIVDEMLAHDTDL